jgi:hypothetical protein
MDEKTLALLDKPFTLAEHGYVVGVGFYILKSAIFRRLREIDPHFKTTPPELVMIDDYIVVMKGGLTLLGDTRHPLGTGRIDHTKKDPQNAKQEIPLTAAEILRNRLKAIKSAASDLLPRGAVLFGVGDYMRDVPREARTKEEFPNWLKHLHAEWEKKYPPAHWAHNGGGQRVQTLMKVWALPWTKVAAQVEQDKGLVLTRLSDTTLSEVEFIARLVILKDVLAREADTAVQHVS